MQRTLKTKHYVKGSAGVVLRGRSKVKAGVRDIRQKSRSPLRRAKSHSKAQSLPPRGRFSRSVATKAAEAKRALTLPQWYEIAGRALAEFPLGARPLSSVAASSVSGATLRRSVFGSVATSAKQFRSGPKVATKRAISSTEISGLPHDMRAKDPTPPPSCDSLGTTPGSEELTARINLLPRDVSLCSGVDSSRAATKGGDTVVPAVDSSSDSSDPALPPDLAFDKEEDGFCFLWYMD